MPAKARARDALTLGVTGATGSLGRLILPRLLANARVARALALDLTAPERNDPKLDFASIDLTRPGCTEDLVRHLSRAGVQALVHLAFFSSPVRDGAYAHEVESVGTAQVLAACAEAGVKRFTMISSTMVYGASPKNPAFLTEDRPLAFHPQSRYVADRVEAERHVQRYRQSHPALRSTVLRLAPMVGPNADNPATRYLGRAVAPVILGFDPLVQCVHEEDAADAVLRSVTAAAHGDFNIAGRGALPLSAALRASGSRPFPLPYPLADAGLRALNALGLMAVPPSLLEYLHFPWIADGSRAERELGFKPRFSSREALLSFSQARRARAA